MAVKKEVVKFLQKNGVETRFTSIVDEKIYINNLKLSRFSRKKEELFLENFPNYEVRRSKVFQKICTRASRVLKTALSPRDKIIISETQDCVNLTLYTVLEPYTRKYGIELIKAGSNFPMGEYGEWINNHTINPEMKSADALAMPLTLDREVEHIINLMLKGDELDLLSSHSLENGMKLVYPLINVPRSWIESWVEMEGLKCNFEEHNGLSRDVLEFMEGFIPDVREKMMSSALYLSSE